MLNSELQLPRARVRGAAVDRDTGAVAANAFALNLPAVDPDTRARRVRVPPLHLPPDPGWREHWPALLLFNNPAVNGECSVFGFSFPEEVSYGPLLNPGSLLNDETNSFLVSEN